MRIRTIKPEFWADEDLSSVSIEANLLAVGLLNYSDDEGYFNANPRLVNASIFPIRALSLNNHGSISDESVMSHGRVIDQSTMVQNMLNELHKIVYIRLFNEVDGRLYGKVEHFTKHQIINRPKPSKIKQIVMNHGSISDASLTNHGRVNDQSPLEQGTGNREQVHKTGETPAPPEDLKTDIPADLQIPEFLKAWESWKSYRREIHKAIKPSTAKRQLDQLAQWGSARAVEAIEASIRQGWTGLFNPAIKAPGSANGKNAAHDTAQPEIVKPTPHSACFWRHPDDPIPTDEDTDRADEWDDLRARLTEEMDPDRFELFDDELTTCEAIGESDLWLVVAREFDRSALLGFRDDGAEVCGLTLHVAVDDREDYASRAALARLPY